jgi:hypothetical protein
VSCGGFYPDISGQQNFLPNSVVVLRITTDFPVKMTTHSYIRDYPLYSGKTPTETQHPYLFKSIERNFGAATLFNQVKYTYHRVLARNRYLPAEKTLICAASFDYKSFSTR